jgi:mannose-6-phosphate isomerase-like protein (cupin superfamily)
MEPRSTEGVPPTISPVATDWRLLDHAHPDDPVDVAAGIAAYEAAPEGDDPEPRPGHPHAELQFVISGAGILRIADERCAVRPGDAYAIPPGLPHTLWATSMEPLRCFYVLLVPRR